LKRRLLFCLSVLLAAVVLCLLPLPSYHSVTLQAVKLNTDYHEVGRVEIPVKYMTSGPAFWKTLKHISVEKIDGFSGFDERNVNKSSFEDYYSVVFGNSVISGDMPTPDNPSLNSLTSIAYRCILKVSDNLDCWYIRITTTDGESDFIYIASVSGESTVEEMLDYFEP